MADCSEHAGLVLGTVPIRTLRVTLTRNAKRTMYKSVAAQITSEGCLEIIALSGVVAQVVELVNRLLSVKGIKNGKLLLTLPSSHIIN